MRDGELTSRRRIYRSCFGRRLRSPSTIPRPPRVPATPPARFLVLSELGPPGHSPPSANTADGGPCQVFNVHLQRFAFLPQGIIGAFEGVNVDEEVYRSRAGVSSALRLM